MTAFLRRKDLVSSDKTIRSDTAIAIKPDSEMTRNEAVMGMEHQQSDVEKVISGGFCVGCGGCAGVDSSISMRFTDYGAYEPVLNGRPQEKADLVCPFSNKGPHENQLGASRDETGQKHKLGDYTALFVGHMTDESKRLYSSSGGGATWLTQRLFENDKIDYVIHVKQGRDEVLFEYGVSQSISEAREGAKTRYYPIETSKVIGFVRDNPGRYVFVGIPCFIKMIKRLAQVDEVIQSRIKYTFSIFCGHMKSAGFAESLAWQMNVLPDQIQTVDFRHKLLDQPANEYGFEAVRSEDDFSIAQMKQLYGKDWGMGAFRLKSCDFCDDIVGELADVSFGDAWLDQYKQDSKGNNIIIVRNPELEALFREGQQSGDFRLDTVSPEDVVRSQDASFRHRRQGVRFRVAQHQKHHKWHPVKREFNDIAPSNVMERVTWRFRGWYSYQTHRVFLKSKQTLSLDNYLRFSKVMIRTNKSLVFFTRAYRAVGRRLKRAAG